MKIIDIRVFELLTTQGTSTVSIKLTVEEEDGWYDYIGSAAHGTSKSSYEISHECRFEPTQTIQKTPWFSDYHTKMYQAVLEIKKEIVGKDLTAEEIDTVLCNINGADNKQHLGSAISLATSIAAYRAEADSYQMSLPAFLSEKIAGKNGRCTIPYPLINIVNGGKHTFSHSVAIQEFLLCPAFSDDFRQDFNFMIFATQEIFAELKQILQKKNIFFAYGEEGGIAAEWNSVEQVFDTILLALERCNLSKYFSLGIDCAATTWYNPKTQTYQFSQNGKRYSSDQLIQWYKSLLTKYPISVIEDPFAEDDFLAWKTFKPLVPFLVGDDITATHTNRLDREDITDLMNAVIVKPDQIGTVTETIDFIKKAKEKHLELVFSRRSAETDDSFIVDLSVSAGQSFCKFGNIAQGSISKYNQLLSTIFDIMYELMECDELKAK